MNQLWRAQAFFAIDRLTTRLLKALQTIHQGLWLGLLDRSALHTVADLQYRTWAKYSDGEYNLSGLLDWENAALDRFFVDCKTVLLGAAGGGREIIGLARLGFQTDAFDCSKSLVESGRALLSAQNIASKFLIAAPEDVPEEFGLYDGLIMGWGGYMHIAGSDVRIKFLKKFRLHVRPNGPILLSFFTRREDSRRFRWICNIARVIRRLRLNSERVEMGDSLNSTFDHHFTKGEIEYEMREAGFELLCYSEEPYGHAVGRAATKDFCHREHREL